MCLRNIVVNIPPPPLRRGPERQGAVLVQGLSVGGIASVKTLLGTSPKKAFPQPQFETAKFNTHTPEVGVQIM